MSLYALWCRDAAGSAEKRQLGLAQHLAHVEENMERIAIAGPLKDENGATIGSMLIVDAPSAVEARKFVEGDPYNAAGVWEEIEVSAFAGVAGTWVGGAAWKK